MPRGYVQLVIYLNSEEERDRIKEFCRQLGIPVSVLVREFFRSLIRGRGTTIINIAKNQVQIGEINIDVKQNIAVQVNNNIIAFLNLKFQDMIAEINKALRSRSPLIMNNDLVWIRNQLEAIMRELKTLSPRRH